MTVRQYIKENGWNWDVKEAGTWRVCTVDIGFINSDGDQDETEFDISGLNVNELAQLFTDFCKENRFPMNTVTGITVKAVAASFKELEEKERHVSK